MRLCDNPPHRGLTNAIDTVLAGAAWRRQMHVMRNVLARVTKGQAEMVAAAIRSHFPPAHGRRHEAVENGP